ncbi:MAG: hypothetical protein K0S58_2849 [Nitrospira sp.]|nr:hypothetical protein [Nitrospira sp.]
METSSPSRIQVTPRAVTTSQCQRDQGRRSIRCGILVVTEVSEAGICHRTIIERRCRMPAARKPACLISTRTSQSAAPVRISIRSSRTPPPDFFMSLTGRVRPQQAAPAGIRRLHPPALAHSHGRGVPEVASGVDEDNRLIRRISAIRRKERAKRIERGGFNNERGRYVQNLSAGLLNLCFRTISPRPSVP